MSGVIGSDGVQWERCNQCAGWCRIDRLLYAPLNPDLPLPQWAKDRPEDAKMPCDLCPRCDAGIPWIGEYRDLALNAEARRKARA